MTGWLTKDREVESVSIGGNQEYKTSEWFKHNVEVKIAYHTFPEEEVRKPEESSAITENFPEEKAHRDAVVAFTNFFATDVFKEDRSTYDPSKFHSYSDLSGYPMVMKSKGNGL